MAIPCPPGPRCVWALSASASPEHQATRLFAGRSACRDGRRTGYPRSVWNARDGKALRQIDLGMEGIGDLAFSPDGKTIAAVGFQPEPKRNVMVNHLDSHRRGHGQGSSPGPMGRPR